MQEDGGHSGVDRVVDRVGVLMARRQCEVFEGPPYRQCRRKGTAWRKLARERCLRVCPKHAAQFDLVRGRRP